MSYGYGGQQNPYDQRDAGQGGYGQSSPFGNSGYNQIPSTEAGYGGSNHEMQPLNTGKNVLNQFSEIGAGIDGINSKLDRLQLLHNQMLNDVDSSSSKQEIDDLSNETMDSYRSLTERVRLIKSDPEIRTKYSAQVKNIDGRLKTAIGRYQQVESDFRHRAQEQMARQYRIVRPDATEEEVRAAVEDTTGGQVFSQALMQSDRQGRARAALSAVQDRHAALVKIEQQMVELAQLFQDMDTLVVQQEAPIMQIEQKAEEVVDNLDKGNDEIGVAVNTARKTRKKKWICLGICVTIIAIIVIVVLIYIFVVKGGGGGGDNKKRHLLGSLAELPVQKTARRFARSLDGDAPQGFQQLTRQRMHLPQIAR